MATGSGGLRVGAGRLAAVAFVIALAWPCELAAQLGGLLPGEQAPIPPAPIPNVPAPPAPTSIGPAPGANLTAPGGGVASPPSPAAPVSPPAASAAPMVPPGQIALAVGARFGRDPPAITGGLLWRVYSEKADQNGAFKLVREVFEIAAGGVRFEGKVGDARIPPGQIHFDLYKGSQFEPGEKRPVAENVASGDVVLLPEGTYHVVSNYGDGNSVMRSDLRVQPSKLVDTTIVHRAAKITLKLVGEKGGEALANTAWSVLTPGGDVIKESIGAFPIVVLAEGDYVVIARNEGKVYNRDFKVEAGVDREIDVVAR